jgi:hypothetical protein
MALTFKEVQRLFRVPPRQRDHDPAWAGKQEFRELTRKQLKARAVDYLANNANHCMLSARPEVLRSCTCLTGQFESFPPRRSVA